MRREVISYFFKINKPETGKTEPYDKSDIQNQLSLGKYRVLTSFFSAHCFLKVHATLRMPSSILDHTVQARRLVFSFLVKMTSTFYSAVADLDNFGRNRFLEVFSSVCADAQADLLNYDRTCQ